MKYTEKGGSITVAADNIGDFIQIKVTDTGKGIPKENRQLLFRKFQQAGKSIYARDASQGTGLGLYISKLMVEGMGGKIELESSEEGKGTTFVFTLPAKKS
jgi:signal transduction histidine kinase